jgi:hypothetical protein
MTQSYNRENNIRRKAAVNWAGKTAPDITGSSMQIGVIADTHSKMRPQALELLKGSGVILHAGDVRLLNKFVRAL